MALSVRFQSLYLKINDMDQKLRRCAKLPTIILMLRTEHFFFHQAGSWLEKSTDANCHNSAAKLGCHGCQLQTRCHNSDANVGCQSRMPKKRCHNSDAKVGCQNPNALSDAKKSSQKFDVNMNVIQCMDSTFRR